VAAEAARSTVTPTAEGVLPDFRLREGNQPQRTAGESKSVHPAVLFGAIGLSVLVSIALVFVDVNPQSAGKMESQAEVRQAVADKYFGLRRGKAPLETYQKLLRDAQVEHDRGDFKAERALYREVLNLLRAERGLTDRGLTGSRPRDKELEEYISVLLDDR